MTENKQFKLSEPHGLYLIKDEKPLYDWIDDDDKIIDLLNDLSDENRQLKKALFFYLDIVLSESLTDFDKWCNLLFDCNYEEAKRNYGDFEYKEKWESE